MSPGALTVPEVAEYLCCSPATVYRLIAARRLPAKKLGRSVRVPKAYLDRWLGSGLVELPVVDDSSGLDIATQAH